MPADRVVLHVDMDAFFASVEMRDDPILRGKPVLVGHDGSRGVVCAASYEARVFGCRSAQPMAVAKRLCPNAIVVPVHFDRYREVSRIVFSIFESITPLVEPLSIDEAFLDVTASQRLFGNGITMARLIKQKIQSQTGVTGSVGVAPNKFLAKLASDLRKPDGLTVITPENLDATLCPLPIGKIWGIGPKTEQRLNDLGIRTIGDLRRTDMDVLIRRVGDEADRYYHRLAFGIDDRPVRPDRQAKSIGQEQTFGTNITDPEVVRSVLLEQAEEIASRLRRHGLHTKSVSVKIRFGDFQTITRQTTLAKPASTTSPIYKAAKELFDTWAKQFQPVRLIGISAGSLGAPEPQMDMFPDETLNREQRLEATLDSINARFGKSSLRRAAIRRPRGE
jgi:DNA polymerase-4